MTMSDDALRDEVEGWLTANWNPSMKGRAAAGAPGGATSAWLTKVVEARWAVPRWPERMVRACVE